MRRYREDNERLVKIGPHYVRRPQATPYHSTWQEIAVDAAKDAGEVILGLIVLLALFMGVPFLLWVIAGGGQ